ncbi:MAG: SGNH/GDSL hydrolase family protein [Gammaproteobacteria bacterium]
MSRESKLPEPTPLTRGDIERLAQFHHPQLMLSELPYAKALDDVHLSAAFGLDAATYRSILESFAAQARRIALRLTDQHAVRECISTVFAEEDRIVALGDSITEDSQSWAEILSQVMKLIRPKDGIRVINAGLSGDTTADLISRFVRLAEGTPTWVMVMIGTNDARRHGTPPSEMMVSHAESERNLAALGQLVRTHTEARIVWVTPPPVLENRVASSGTLRRDHLTWRQHDVAAKRKLVRALPDLVVDPWSETTPRRLEGLLSEDGVHPNLRGQQNIATCVIMALANQLRLEVA